MRRLHRGARPGEGRALIVYEPANACILLLGQLDGAELVTVEDLAAGGRLHPVQQALVDHHGSQCGFCTPGFVMSLFTLHQEGGGVDREAVLSRISGNLCRCTGYRPIVDAAEAAMAVPDDRFHARAAETVSQLERLHDDKDLFVADGEGFFAAPASLDALCALAEAHPDATLLGGATDVGLWITKQLRTLPKILHTGRVTELRRLVDDGASLSIGAAVTYAEATQALSAFDPDVACCWSVSARHRCAPPARSAATWPTARPSATPRRSSSRWARRSSCARALSSGSCRLNGSSWPMAGRIVSPARC